MRKVANKETDLTSTGQGGHTPHGEEKQQELVRAAYDLIAERGFEGLRTRDVAARASVTVATLHYYFPTKEDLIRGVMTVAMEQFRRRTLDPEAPAREPGTDLREVLQVRQRQMKETPQLFTVLLELTTRASRDPAIKAIMRESDTAWRENISLHLQAGVQKGVFRPDLDVPAAAVVLEALSRGRAMLTMLNLDKLLDERINAEVERWLTGKSGEHSGQARQQRLP
jgi:AcrR family transcriptional regulator